MAITLQLLPTAPAADPRLPIYSGTRSFLGRRDLVVSFYTKKCQFKCAYCALPQRSAGGEVDVEEVNAQIDELLAKHADDLPTLQQLSFGNEGSALDARRFHRESLHYLLDRVRDLPALELISIETRPEYIRRDALEDVLARVGPRSVDVTVGFETQDDHVRMTILNKQISRRVMEERIALLGELGVRLTSYVMVKPAPRMTEEEGVREAIATIEYLRDRCSLTGAGLIAYLTPTYIAEGSELARTVGRDRYSPPTIQSVLRVIVAGRSLGVPVYTGLWSEGLAGQYGDFRGRDGYDPGLRDAIAQFNRTDDFSLLDAFLAA